MMRIIFVFFIQLFDIIIHSGKRNDKYRNYRPCTIIIIIWLRAVID